MNRTQKITIFELAPCADTIYQIRQDPEKGYTSTTTDSITISNGATLRPEGGSTHAGGKATNVARVIDKLLSPEDQVEIELVVFRPDSPKGRYIHDLQSAELRNVRIRPIIVDSTARFCTNLWDPSNPNGRVEFNISPHPRWAPNAVGAALETASKVQTDLLLLAGNPPLVPADPKTGLSLPSMVIQAASGASAVTLDTAKVALAACLESPRRPEVIKINRDEYASVSADLWSDFDRILIVTDSGGADLHPAGLSGLKSRLAAPEVNSVYSTVGAGDAAHAAFTLAYWIRGYDPVQAGRFAMAASAAAVSSPLNTRGISQETVQQFFSNLDI